MLTSLREFFRYEAAGGIVLIIVSVLAILLANSPFSIYYNYLQEVDFGFIFGEGAFQKPILFWVNDALMVIFFLLVGLEIKREFMEGELSSVSQATLPVVAAIFGIVVPAIIYILINIDNPETIKGWAIPAATDIAFALGILALAGKRAPLSLKVFLTAIAIIDDLLAILIIAFFYTGGLEWQALATAPLFILGLFLLNRNRITALTPYMLLGILLWIDLKTGGLHPTLAGVMVALSIPLKGKSPNSESSVKYLEHSLHPWVAFLIIPVFGFANAGVSFEGMSWESFLNPLTLGIIGGLFLGKQLGIFVAVWFVIKMGWAELPKRANWVQTYAVCVLCGVGFTMSLFIGALAFQSVEQAQALRLGVLVASFLSAVMGYLLLKYGPSNSTLTQKGTFL